MYIFFKHTKSSLHHNKNIFLYKNAYYNIVVMQVFDRGGKGSLYILWYSLQNNSPFANSNLGKRTFPPEIKWS